MEAQDFQLLRDLIRAHAGILFGNETAYLLERRVQPRLQALGLSSINDYCYYLGRAAAGEREAEIGELCEHIVTHETYFFRESYQLSAFREEILPQLAQKGGAGRLRLWSAGCSTGEEAYTIAIQVLETGLFGGMSVEVMGTDLSSRALRVAQAGQYGRSSFRQADPAEDRLKQRYFREVGGREVGGREGRYEVIDEVRRMVTFRRHNLMGGDWSGVVGTYDVIFCRNVLIYLDRSLRLGLIERFGRRLRGGGYLLLGHSESLLDTQTSFEVIHLRREMVYRKRNA